MFGLPIQRMRTYSIKQPLATHFRKATCAEVECPHYHSGWRVDAQYVGEAEMHTIKAMKYRFVVVDEGSTTKWLVFEPGQSCFQATKHVVPIGRPEIYVIRDGDRRGNPTGRSAVVGVQTWLDEFNDNAGRIQEMIKEG